MNCQKQENLLYFYFEATINPIKCMPVASMRKLRRLPLCAPINLEKSEGKPHLQKLRLLMKMKKRIFNHYLNKCFSACPVITV